MSRCSWRPRHPPARGLERRSCRRRSSRRGVHPPAPRGSDAILSSGVASARKSSTPASSAIARAVSGLSPVIITVRIPMRRSSSNRSRIPSFTTSFRWMTPRTRASSLTGLGDDQWRSSGDRHRVDRRPDLRLVLGPRIAHPAEHGAAAPLRICLTRRPRSRSTPLMRVWAVKGTKVAWPSSPSSERGARYSRLREHDDRAPLGSLVGQARQLRGVCELCARPLRAWR